MTFQTLQFNLDNLFQGDFNALIFTAMAMSVVFIGLVLVYLYLITLPVVFKLFEKKAEVNPVGNMIKKDPRSADLDSDLYTAIALAIHLEQSQETRHAFTWDTKAPNDHSWQQAMHSRVISSRQALPLRRQ